MPNSINIKETLHDYVLVKNMNSGETVTTGGIVLRSDNATSHGVRPRWAEVYVIGPKQSDVKVGQWVLIEHGRWTRKVTINTADGEIDLQRIDVTGILAVSETEPADQYIFSIHQG